MFKKIVFMISLSVTFLLFAFDYETVYAEEFEYNYMINGISIDSNVKLSEAQLQFLISNPEDQVNQNYGLITPSSIDGGGNAGTIIDGPYQTTLSNRDSRAFVTLAATWIGQKLPPAKPYAYGLAAATFVITELQVDRYIGSWVWKAFDTSGYIPVMKKYITVVEYNTKDFVKDSVKKITVQEAGYY